MNINSIVTKTELKWLMKNVKNIYVSMPKKNLKAFEREFGRKVDVNVIADDAKTSAGNKMKYAASYMISLAADNAPTKKLRELITFSTSASGKQYPHIYNSALATYLVNNYPDNFSIKQK